jgi:DNA-binding MarR family transcriptional regulator
MDRYRLLEAIWNIGKDKTPPHFTSAAIGRRLGVGTDEAEAALRDAERAGLVVEEQDESLGVGRDFNRQLWRFSDAGRAEFYRLQDEQRGP